LLFDDVLCNITQQFIKHKPVVPTRAKAKALQRNGLEAHSLFQQNSDGKLETAPFVEGPIKILRMEVFYAWKHRIF